MCGRFAIFSSKNGVIKLFNILNNNFLISENGYFEWDKKKQPHFIFSQTIKLFSFAGIYDISQDANNSRIITFSIITKKADENH